MKHKHYDMIVAKAANMDLVQFIKIGDKWEIIVSHDNQTVNFGDHYDYFLCLPQHKGACLHWLNGGKVQDHYKGTWEDCGLYNGQSWDLCSLMMDEEHCLRIKPRKEKRWIAYCASRNQTVPHPQDTRELCEDYTMRNYSYKLDEWQFIEIEVEA